MSVRFNSNLITIWNRDGANEKTKEGILAVVLEKVSPELKPLPRNYYYKKHSEHAGFSEVVARASEKSKKAEEGKIAEAVVKVRILLPQPMIPLFKRPRKIVSGLLCFP